MVNPRDMEPMEFLKDVLSWTDEEPTDPFLEGVKCMLDQKETTVGGLAGQLQYKDEEKQLVFVPNDSTRPSFNLTGETIRRIANETLERSV